MLLSSGEVEPPSDGGHGGTDHAFGRLEQAAGNKRGRYQVHEPTRRLRSPGRAFTVSAASMQIALVVRHQATVSAVQYKRCVAVRTAYRGGKQQRTEQEGEPG